MCFHNHPRKRNRITRLLAALFVSALLGPAFFASCSPFSQQCRPLQGQRYEIHAESNNSRRTIPTTNIEICPENFRHNLEVVKKRIGPDVRLCVVMKSDAYGHGIGNLVPQAVSSEPAYIAAISNTEFRIIHDEIRKQNKNIALLRIAPVLHHELIESIIKGWNVEEIIGSPEEARMISETAESLSRHLAKDITVNVHVNIETGIGRMAFRDVNEIKKALQLSHLRLKGVMTHFANAYEKEPVAFKKTRQQTEKFDITVAQLALEPSIIRHIANSAATVRFPWTRKDMVRVGTLLYGEDIEDLDPDHELRPVMVSFKSRVAIIENKIPPMSPIGYDSMQYTSGNRLTTTATVRAGYSEGFPEMAFDQNMQVLIRGRKFPVIGKTSMNMVVVDITDQDKDNPVQLNDEVVIFGKQGDQEITLEEFAAQSHKEITPITILLGKAVDRTVVFKDLSER